MFSIKKYVNFKTKSLTKTALYSVDIEELIKLSKIEIKNSEKRVLVDGFLFMNKNSNEKVYQNIIDRREDLLAIEQCSEVAKSAHMLSELLYKALNIYKKLSLEPTKTYIKKHNEEIFSEVLEKIVTNPNVNREFLFKIFSLKDTYIPVEAKTKLVEKVINNPIFSMEEYMEYYLEDFCKI